MALDEFTDYGIDNGVLIIASDYEPNNSTITYWIDTTLDPNGKIIKYYDRGTDTWVRLLSDTTGGGGSGGSDTPDLDELWKIVNEQQETVIVLLDKYYLLLQKMRVYTEDLLNTNQYTSALAKQVIDNTGKINALLGKDLTDTIDQLQSEIRDLLSVPGIPTKIDPDLDNLQDAGTFKILQNNADGSVTIYTLMQTVQTVRDNKEAYIQLRMGYPSTVTGIERRTYNIDIINGWSKWVEIGEHDEPIVPAIPDIYFRYATKPDFSDFLTATSENALYMGIQKNNFGYEVQEIGEYRWSRIKGTQGLQGPTGLQGTQGLRGKIPNHTFTLYKKVKKGVDIDIPSTNRVEFTDINVGTNAAVQGWTRVLDTTLISDDEVIYSTVGYADTELDRVTRYLTRPVKVNAFDGKDMTEMWDFKYKATAQADVVPTISNTSSKTLLLREGWANEASVSDNSKFVWVTKGKFDTASDLDNMIVDWSRPVLMNKEGEPGIQGAVIRMVGEFTNTPKKDATGEDLYYQSGNNMWSNTVNGIPFDNSKFIDVVVKIEGGLYYYYRCNKAIKIADAPNPGTSEDIEDPQVWIAFELYQALATNVLLADNAFLRCVQGGQMIIQGDDEADPLSNKGWLMTAGSIRHFDRLDMAGNIHMYKYLNIDLDESGNVFFGKTYIDDNGNPNLNVLVDKETNIQAGKDGNGYYMVNAFFTDGSGHIGRLLKLYKLGCEKYSNSSTAFSWSSSNRSVAILDYLILLQLEKGIEGGPPKNRIYFKTENFNLNKSLLYRNNFAKQCVMANGGSSNTDRVNIPVDPPRIGTWFSFTYLDDAFKGPRFLSEELWTTVRGIDVQLLNSTQYSIYDPDEIWDLELPQTSILMREPSYMSRSNYEEGAVGIKLYVGYEGNVHSNWEGKRISALTFYEKNTQPTSEVPVEDSAIDGDIILPVLSMGTRFDLNYGNDLPFLEMKRLLTDSVTKLQFSQVCFDIKILDNIGKIEMNMYDGDKSEVLSMGINTTKNFNNFSLSDNSSYIVAGTVVCTKIQEPSKNEIVIDSDVNIPGGRAFSLWGKLVYKDSNGFLKVA